jgi:hypothetical protein
MHWPVAFAMGVLLRCLKNRLLGAYFGSKPLRLQCLGPAMSKRAFSG